jgi:hypothetical protein
MEIETIVNLTKQTINNSMRRLTFIFGLSYLLTSCAPSVNLFTVDNSKIGVKYAGVRGTIFNDNYPFVNFLMLELDSMKRWTPNADDIKLAEKILKDQIKNVNKNKPNQMDRCPTIHRHLNDYFRQYVGLINEKGHKVVHINMSWDKFTLRDRIVGNSDSRLDFKSDYSMTLDGCSYYWQVTIDMDDKKISGFGVNGVG